MTGPGTDPPVRVRISETLVARLAAHHALGVPGVLALRADLGRTLLTAAGSVLGSAAPRAAPGGAGATVADGRAEVTLIVVTRLGHNCRDLAQAVQQAAATAVTAHTGLAATVAVTVAEVIPDWVPSTGSPRLGPLDWVPLSTGSRLDREQGHRRSSSMQSPHRPPPGTR